MPTCRKITEADLARLGVSSLGVNLAALNGETVDTGISEKEFQAAVVKEAKRLGWKVYHTHDSRKSEAGFPDLVCCRDRVLWIELKTELGKLSAAQSTWLDALQAAGQEAGCFRPSDWERMMELLQCPPA